MDDNRYMFLITGASGAGKSTLAHKLASNANVLIEPISDIREADDYWYILGHGKYKFVPHLLPKAHQWCQDGVRNILDKGLNVIVSNTNIRPRDRAPYFKMAKEYGYKVVYIHLTTQFQNQHNVPDEAVKRMRDNYIDLTPEEKSLVVKSGEMSDELEKLLKKVGVVHYEY